MSGIVQVSDYVAAICPVRNTVRDVESFSDIGSVEIVFSVIDLSAERQSGLGLSTCELDSCLVVKHSLDEVSLRTGSSIEITGTVKVVWIKIRSLAEELVNHTITSSESSQLAVVIAVVGVSVAASLNSLIVERLSDQPVVIVEWDQGIVVQRERVNSVTDSDSLEVREVSLISSYLNSESWDVDTTVRFSSDVEVTVLVFGELVGEEVDQSVVIVLSDIVITSRYITSGIVTESHSGRGFEEDDVTNLVPGIGVEVDSASIITNMERSKFFNETSERTATWSSIQPENHGTGIWIALSLSEPVVKEFRRSSIQISGIMVESDGEICSGKTCNLVFTWSSRNQSHEK